MTWGAKDPAATRDYGIDWSADIGSATISTSTWLLNGATWPDEDAPLTKVSQSNSTTTTTIRLSGGTAGQSYRVTNRVVLSNGETDDFTQTLRVRDR